MTDRDLGQISKRDATRLPIVAKAGMIAGLGLGTLSIIACGAEAKKNVSSPDGNNTPVPQATPTDVLTPTIEPDPTNTPESAITLTPGQLQNRIYNALSTISVDDSNTARDIQNIKNEFEAFSNAINDPEFKNNPRHLIVSILNALGGTGNRMIQLSCANPNNFDLPNAVKEVKAYTMNLIDKYENVLTAEGNTIEEVKRLENEAFFTVLPNCPNKFLTASN